MPQREVTSRSNRVFWEQSCPNQKFYQPLFNHQGIEKSCNLRYFRSKIEIVNFSQSSAEARILSIETKRASDTEKAHSCALTKKTLSLHL